MNRVGNAPLILMAEDDPEDVMFAQDALAEAKMLNPFVVVEDGQELLDYLRGTGMYGRSKNENV